MRTMILAVLSPVTLSAAPFSHYLIIGDSTMRMNCDSPGWLPDGAECRAVGGESYPGYLRQLQRGPCARKDIVVGSIGLNSGLGFRPLQDVQAEFDRFIGALRLQCPESRLVLVGINQNRIMPEWKRQMFNAYAAAFADQYIEPPFGLDRVPDGVHYSRDAAWMLRPMIFTEDD